MSLNRCLLLSGQFLYEKELLCLELLHYSRQTKCVCAQSTGGRGTVFFLFKLFDFIGEKLTLFFLTYFMA